MKIYVVTRNKCPEKAFRYILDAIRYVNDKNEEDVKVHNGARIDIYSFDEIEVEWHI